MLHELQNIRALRDKPLRCRLLYALAVLAAAKGLGLLISRRQRIMDGRSVQGAGEKEKKVDGKDEAETSEENQTWINKEALQILLAFVAGWYDVVCFKQYKCYANMMTGNTLNMCMSVGNRQYADASLLGAAIVNFCGGFTAFKYFDTSCKSRGTCTAVAPLIFCLFAAAERLRKAYPQSRWHVLLLAVAGGIMNSVSQQRAGIVTNMMTGHYQKLCGDLSDLLSKGLGKDQRASALLSLRMVITFCSAVSLSMAAWNVKKQYAVNSGRSFTIIGGIYAAILVLHELPVNFLQRKQRAR